MPKSKEKSLVNNGQFKTGHSCFKRQSKYSGQDNKRYFQKGHTYYRPHSSAVDNTVCDNLDYERPDKDVRLTKDLYAKVAKRTPGGGISIPDAEGRPGAGRLLRPKPSPPDVSTEYMTKSMDRETNSEMRLVNMDKCTDMMNKCIEQHLASGCQVPNFGVHKEVKWGLGWRMSLKCNNCQYQSGLYKLYNEVDVKGPGPKAACCNVGLQVGLQDSPLGNTRARMLIATTNTPPPCRSSMQKAANKVGAITSTVAEDDLVARRNEIKEINRLRGLPESCPINISMDVRYNSTTITSRHKMGQNASQAVGVVVESQTDQKQIIGMYMENQLCWVGSWLRNRGFYVECPGHANCTANKASTEPLSERHIGERIGEDLVDEEIFVRFVTTDGDARGAEGIKEAMTKLEPLWEVERQADTTHLGQSQFRNTVKAVFSQTMFPGETADHRKHQQKMLGLDLKNRSHCIFNELYAKYAGNIEKIARIMPKVIQTTLDCYSGDCKRCRYHSVVCSGGQKDNWWAKSVYLSPCGIRSLNITPRDRDLLRAILLLKLGVASLRLIRSNTNTNKNEAINRGISVSLPKNVNFARNAKARAYSAIHRLNLGAGNSMIKKLEAVGSPIERGRRVAKAALQIQRDSRYHIDYTRTTKFKRALMKRKVRQIKEFYAAKRKRRGENEYKKGQLDPVVPSKRKRKPISKRRLDHTYATRSKTDHNYAVP